MIYDLDEMRKKKIVIGEITFTDPINEYAVEGKANPLNLSKLGPCTVEVYEREGNIPHIHIKPREGKQICICLHTAMYFSHKEHKYQQFSNAKQMVEFNEWMSRPNVKYCSDRTRTNFQVAVELWAELKNPVLFDMSVQPDYSNMLGEIKSNK